MCCRDFPGSPGSGEECALPLQGVRVQYLVAEVSHDQGAAKPSPPPPKMSSK